MMESEDEEIILKDSPLDCYLSQYSKETFSAYSKEPSPLTKFISTASESSLRNVEGAMFSCVNKILQSRLLLEEDASFLFGISSELSPSQSNLIYKVFLLNVLVAVGTGFSYFYAKGILYLMVLAIIFTICSTVHTLVKHILLILCERKVRSIINVLNELHHYIRKTFKHLRELEMITYSLDFKYRNDTDKGVNNIFWDRKIFEISDLQESFCRCLLDIINESRNITLKVRSVFPVKISVDQSDCCLALSTPEQLGLNEYSENSKKTLSSSSLEVLKNVYLLMQSESLRRIGMCFCANVWEKSRTDLFLLFHILRRYNNDNERILCALRQKYEVRFSSEGHKRKIISSKWTDGCNLLHSLSLSLKSLLFEVQLTEGYLEKCSSESDSIILEVNSKLTGLNMEFHKTLNILQESVNYFKHLQKRNTHHNTFENEKVPIVLNQDSAENQKMFVGLSDFTPKESDKVYFCITNNKNEENLEQDEGVALYDPKPILPESLLGELKLALLPKRKEFEERELKAMELNENYREYLSSKKSLIGTSCRDQESFLDNFEKVSSPEDACSEHMVNVSFESTSFIKMIASSAALKSSDFKSEEIIYESDSDTND